MAHGERDIYQYGPRIDDYREAMRKTLRPDLMRTVEDEVVRIAIARNRAENDRDRRLLTYRGCASYRD